MTYLALVANAGDATITSFRVDDDTLTPLATTALPGPSSTFVVDATRDLLYAGCKPNLLVTYALDRAGGVLAEVARAEVETSLTYLDLAHDGGVLLAASYGGGTGYAWPVADGALGSVASRIERPFLHCVVATADQRAYFVSLGADLVAQFDVAPDGALAPLATPTVALPAGSGPRHLAFDAAAANAYVVTEFSGEVIRLERRDGSLTPRESVSIVDPAAGLGHSRYGADPTAEHLIWGADVHVTDRFLLASERSASTLATVALVDGALGDVVALTPTEAQPRGFALTPDGARVLAVGERSTDLALSRIEPDGTLTPLDRAATGRGANWVRVLPL